MFKMPFTAIMLLASYVLAINAFANECTRGDCSNGVGTLEFSSGAIIHGEFQNNKTHGYTLSFLRNGTICEGYSRRGVWHGLRHCWYDKSGKRFYGNYNSGRISAEGLYIESDGSISKEGFYYRGKLQRTYVTDRERLLERLMEMRANAPAEITSLIPLHMKVFYIPNNSQTRLSSPPIFVESKETDIRGTAPLPIPKNENPTIVTGSIFSSPKYEPRQPKKNSDLPLAKPKPQKKDPALVWAEQICEEEGYNRATDQFRICISEMMPLF